MTVIYGASGHGRVVYDILTARGVTVDLFLDDQAHPPHAGCEVRKPSELMEPVQRVIVAIGDNRARKRIAAKYHFNEMVAIHPRAVISPHASIAQGSVIMPLAVVNSAARIGKLAIINTGAIIEHDCVLGDYVHVSPAAVLCGGVQVGEGAHIGSGAIVIPGVKIGRWSAVGAGAVVIRDVPDYSVVVGNPGKVIKTLPPLS